MKTRYLFGIALALAALLSPQATTRVHAAPPKGFEKVDATIVIETLVGRMKYSREEFSVEPGAKICVVIDNKDELQHNFVLCQEGKGLGIKIAEEAMKLGEDGFAKAWVPEDERILAASGMVDPHQKTSVYFVAPSKPGRYEYVCTFPGHFILMNGVMTVSGETGGAAPGSTPLSELTYTVYQGNFNKLPDFSKLEPKGTDHVPSGLFDMSVTKLRDKFALVFDGILAVPSDGSYTFNIGSDDGSRLLIDGRTVVSHDGIHAMSNKSGKTELSKGKHRIRYEYFEASGEEELYVGWSGPGFKEQSLCTTSPERNRGGRAPSGILLASEHGEAKIYRNFIEKGGVRAIGVGYPGGYNITFDADSMNMSLMWKGDFIDAARHWNGRGQGFQPPASSEVMAGTSGEPFAILDSPNSAWPNAEPRSLNTRFRGYKLDKQRFPTFGYTMGELSILDRPAPTPEGLALTRRFTFKGSIPGNLYYRAAVSSNIKKVGDYYETGEGLRIAIEGATPVLATMGGRTELRIHVGANDTKQVDLRYRW